MLNYKKGYIIIFIISVIGLAFIQYQYLRIGLNLAKVQFNSKIGQSIETIKADLSTKNELTFLMQQAITKDNSHFKLSIDSIQDASSHFLNDFLIDRLLQRGIKTSFEYRLYKNDSVLYLKSPIYNVDDDEDLKFPIVLNGYLPNSIGERLILELQFEDVNSYFLSQLNGLTIPSLIFIAAIILVVIWVLRSMYWQRNIITTTNEFINNLTHELKTPVFSIGLAAKLLEEKSSEETKPIITIIKEQNEKLKTHIDKVLDLAGIESKKSVVKLQLQDFYPALKQLALSFSRLSSVENINFEYTLSDGPYWIKCELNHLENVINNLLDNAKKYSDEIPAIKLESYITDGYLYIAVSDRGIGIDKANMKLIFKKYHRVSSGDIQKVRGYGLGLSYVKEIVRMHKGSVLLESTLGEGTKVTVKLPIQKA